jgi:hydroxypyruvate reductase
MAGDEDAAGGVVTSDTLPRARVATLDPRARRVNHDSVSFFARIGDLVWTGSDRTNVNDIIT